MMKIVDIYISTFLESFHSVLKAWRQILIQIPVLFVVGLVSPLIAMLGMIGGFILGILYVFIVSYYLVLVRNVVLKEKFSLHIIKYEGLNLFQLAMTLFVGLFIVNLALSLVQVLFLKLAVGILICVLLNPIIEFLYLEESNIGDLVQSSFEFISKYFIVWFAPMIVCMSPLIIKNPNNLLVFFSQDPLNMLRSTLSLLSNLFRNPSMAIAFIPILYAVFFIMVFRGKLILKLR